MRRAVILSAVLVLGSPLAAQSPSFVTIPDVETEVGQSFTLRVEVDTTVAPGDVHLLGLFFQNNPEEIKIVDWSFGEGLRSHMETHGQPPRCDIEFDAASGGFFAGIMFLETPFDSTVHGSEWLVLDYQVTASEPGASLISVFVESELAHAEFTVGVDRKPRVVTTEIFQRGDVNNDLACNLTDAVNILEHLFKGSRQLSCPDAADVDDDGTVQLTDAVVLLNALFRSGTPIDETCNVDAVEDSLAACESSGC